MTTPGFIQETDNEIAIVCGVKDDFISDVSGYRDDRGFVTNKIAEFITRYHNYAWLGDVKGEFIKYINGKWYFDVEISLNKLIRKYINYSKYKLRGGIGDIRDDIKNRLRENHQVFREQINVHRRVMNFTNCFLSLDDFTTRVHDSTSPPIVDGKMRYYTIQIPHEYHEDLTPLKFLPWLCERLEYDWKRIDLLIKSIGYTLGLDINFQKIIFLKDGPKTKRKGKTGKSSFLKILNAVIGDSNKSTIPLQRLAQRFGTSGIVNKVMNYYADISTSQSVRNNSRIKMLIDDEIDYEVKGGGFHTVKNTVKHYFSMNKTPPVEDIDLAYCRRICIIIFDKRITNPITNFEDSITNDENELEAIISLAVDAYKELCEDGEFMSQDAEEVMDIIMMETDSVYRFIKEMCDIGPDYFEPQELLYGEYAEFAAADGASAVLQKGAFTNDLFKKGYTRGRLTHLDDKGKRPYTYVGLKLKTTEFIPKKLPKQIEIFTPLTSSKTGAKSLLEEACEIEIENENIENENVEIDKTTNKIKDTSVKLNEITLVNGRIETPMDALRKKGKQTPGKEIRL